MEGREEVKREEGEQGEQVEGSKEK